MSAWVAEGNLGKPVDSLCDALSHPRLLQLLCSQPQLGASGGTYSARERAIQFEAAQEDARPQPWARPRSLMTLAARSFCNQRGGHVSHSSHSQSSREHRAAGRLWPWGEIPKSSNWVFHPMVRASELDDLERLVLDERFTEEDLPNVESYELEELVPSGIASRRAALWAPWHSKDGEPPPRATGDDEPRWSLTDRPGLTPREAVAADSEARKREEMKEQDALSRELSGLAWQLEFNHDDPFLLATRAGGDLACFEPPPALFGARSVSSSAWVFGRYSDREDAFDSEVEPENPRFLDWPEFFTVFPAPFHPLAVDAVFSVVQVAMDWVGAVGGHALAAGAVEPIEQSTTALEGIVAVRERLESCRAAGLVQDDRLTRYGLRHQLCRGM